MTRTGSGRLGISSWGKNVNRLENRRFDVMVSGNFYDEVNSARNDENIYRDNSELIRSLLREYVDKKRRIKREL